jgi:hypothetical protein
MDLDHVFLCIAPGGPEPDALAALGLRQSFRRAHPGQGTANLCYCFDNAYLELLWLTDAAAARAAAVGRTRLAERARWPSTGASPFGLALRGGDADDGLPFETWNYRPAYLPADRAIPVAAFSDDPAQPFVFRSPGTRRPDRWTDGRAGARQREAGLREIAAVDLHLPAAVTPAPGLLALADCGWLRVTKACDRAQMILTVTMESGEPRRLSLPDCRWV